MSNKQKKYIVVYRTGARKDAERHLSTRGVSFGNEFDAGEGDIDLRSIGDDPVVLPDLEMASVTMDDDMLKGVQATRSGSDAVMLIEEVRQYFVQPIDDTHDGDASPPVGDGVQAGVQAATMTGAPMGVPGGLSGYLQGYVQGVNNLAGSLLGGHSMAVPVTASPLMGSAPFVMPASVQTSVTLPSFEDGGASVASGGFTWGLQATRASRSQLTGAGIKVAVLDTGFDFSHPDFPASRFGGKNHWITNSAHDVHGHGTHCTGTACGPRSSSEGYGVAPDAIIYVGKVMDDTGRGDTATIGAGISWALSNGCRVCSISIGAQNNPSQAVEIMAQRAISRNMAVIAAAGNDSSRPSIRKPVSDPANCTSVMAVASLGRNQFGNLRLSNFSNGSQPPWIINIAGPGEKVRSSFPVAKGSFGSLTGTSQATPHVSGVAALVAQSRPDWNGGAVMNAVLQLAAEQPNSVGNVGQIGQGLVQAPLNVNWNA